MKKIFVLFVIALLCAGMVFAGGSAEDGQVFEISHNATSAEQNELLETMFAGFIADYNMENNTDYVLKYTGSQGMDITNTRMSSNNKPDLFVVDSPADVMQYEKSDLLYNLDAYAEEQDWKTTMFNWAYNLSKVDGTVYTLPYGYEGIVLWYNKDILKSLGLTTEDIMDADGFNDALELASENGYTPIMLGTQDWPWAQEWYLSVMMSYTGRDLLKDVLLDQSGATWTDEKFVETVDLYKEWHDKGFLTDGKSYILTSDDAINAFTNDKALFKMEGTWAPYWITPLATEAKEKIGVMLHPSINSTEVPHIPIAVGQMWCVSKDTESADLAGYILGRLLDSSIQGEFLKLGLDVAPMSISPDEFSELDPIVENMWLMLNEVLAQGDYGYTTYAFYPAETRLYIYEGIVSVLEGDISTEEYLARVQELNDKERAAGFVPILP